MKLRKRVLAILLFICVPNNTVFAQSYNPNGPGPGETPYITDNFSKPVIVTEWWTSLIWNKMSGGPFSDQMHAHPFSLRCMDKGLGLCYPNQLDVYCDGNGGAGGQDNVYKYNYSEDLLTGLEGVTFSETKAEDYSDWDVLANWSNGSNVLRARMGNGFCYTYLTKESAADVFVTTNGTVKVSNNALRITVEKPVGDDGLGGNRHYAVFAPTGSSWEGSGPYKSNLNGKEYWSVAVLPDESDETFNTYAKYAFAFITKTTSSYKIEKGKVTTTFDVTYDNKEGDASATMFAVYRHQWKHTDQVNTDYTYASPRNIMKVIEGKNFSITMPVIGAIPLLPKVDDLPYTELNGFVDGFNYMQQSGNYSLGRELIYCGQVALIADQIDNTAKRDELINYMKNILTDQFNFDNDARYLGYNETWNITCNITGNQEHGTVAFLNDRAIQYGYWVRAAAIVGMYDKEWLKKYEDIIEMYIRDVGNTNRDDKMFPFMRNFDVYSGHSYSTGFALSDGCDLESASESLNFASGLLLYGQVSGKKEFEDRGVWLYTNEVIGTEQYWWDVENEVFPEDKLFGWEMLGMVRSAGGFYALWWELRPEHVFMVNCFPWTGGALYLGRYPEACKRIFTYMEQKGFSKYREYTNPYHALFDPDAAVAQFVNGEGEYGHGSTDYGTEMEAKANGFFWTRTLQARGQVYKDIYALNHSSALVFDKDGDKYYAIYNPPGSGEKTVKFSNGLGFKAPDNSLAWYDSSQSSIKVKPVVNKRFEVNNYPNPFTLKTNIHYKLDKSNRVSISIYSITGKKLVTLINQVQPAGVYTIGWNGNDGKGFKLPAGIYMYKFTAGNRAVTKRMIFKH